MRAGGARVTEPTIALLTDFGTQDTYVGVMKGVISGIAPQARLIDLTHAVPQGDVKRGAYHLWVAVPFFPAGTTFLVVIDPGVGTARRPLAVEWSQWRFVLPDNGLLTYLLAQEPARRAVVLASTAHRLSAVSTTFHGRDLFAPAAAHLARGVALEELGPEAQDLVRFPLPRLELEPDRLRGEVIHADRFGNVITSLGVFEHGADKLTLKPWLPGPEQASCELEGTTVALPDGTRLPLQRTFGEVPAGSPLAYVGSDGLLEIGINGGRAADALHLKRGDEIVLLLGSKWS